MDNPIPWAQLKPPQALQADAEETVDMLRRRLRNLGGRAQYNIPILIHLPDGAIAPTSAAMLRRLAAEMGATILHRRLGDLVERLCPQPWTAERAEAEQAATRRRLPVIVTGNGRPVGLALPPARAALIVTVTEEDFDLFDDPLLPDDPTIRPVVSAHPDETVAQVVARLKELPDPETAPVVVQMEDGSYRLVERQLDREIENFVAEVWNRSLKDLADRFRPVSARRLANLGREQARALSRRTPLLLLDEEGTAVGLMLPRRLRMTRPGGFDLFDEPLEQIPPGQPDLHPTEAIWVVPHTPLAEIAWQLRGKEADRVRIVVEQADGSFGLLTVRELNRRLSEEGWEALGRPLSDLFPTLPTVPARPFAQVGRRQVLTLLEREKRLILTMPDREPILLERWEAPPIMREAPPLDICRVPSHLLRRYLSWEMAVAMDTTPSPPTPREPRYVNLWFAEEDPAVPHRGALVQGRSYRLAVQIGALQARSIVAWDRTPGGPRPIVEPQERDAYLYISLFSQDFDIPEPTQALRLPREGETDILAFEIIPLRRTPAGERAELTLCLYYRTYLVQTFAVEAEIVAPGEAARSDKPQTARLTHARVSGFPEMETLPTRHLSLTITRDGLDRYRFTFLVDPDPDDAEAARRALALSCTVRLTRDDLTHLITKARRQLYNVVQVYETLREGKRALSRKALRALAQVGRQLYLKIFESTSAQALRDWMEANLPDGSILQVVDLAGDFVFPWSLVYTEPPWADDKPVDVTKFWGWRYQLVILTAHLLDTYRQAPPTITAEEPLRISVGLYERLMGISTQKAFFAGLPERSGQRVMAELRTRRRTMSRDLRDADRDLYYFFCHGYTERIATDIQLDADLLDLFARTAAAASEEQSESLREHLADLFDVSDSWLRLTRGKIPLTMLKETVPAEFSRHPLVFLNMCESAQVLPSLSDGFVPFFLQRGARAVIGTECSMNTRFADEFARAFLDRFFRGEPVGAILLALRRQFLERDDPLALAYTLYCDADLRLSQPLLEEEHPPGAPDNRVSS